MKCELCKVREAKVKFEESEVCERCSEIANGEVEVSFENAVFFMGMGKGFKAMRKRIPNAEFEMDEYGRIIAIPVGIHVNVTPRNFFEKDEWIVFKEETK